MTLQLVEIQLGSSAVLLGVSHLAVVRRRLELECPRQLTYSSHVQWEQLECWDG